MEYFRPTAAINCQLSVMENIIIDDIPAYLMYLQDLFPHLDKYRYTEELSKLVDRIEKIMMDGKIDTPCDRALLFDYKAHLFIEKKDFDNAIKSNLHRKMGQIDLSVQYAKKSREIKTIPI